MRPHVAGRWLPLLRSLWPWLKPHLGVNIWLPLSRRHLGHLRALVTQAEIYIEITTQPSYSGCTVLDALLCHRCHTKGCWRSNHSCPPPGTEMSLLFFILAPLDFRLVSDNARRQREHHRNCPPWGQGSLEAEIRGSGICTGD